MASKGSRRNFVRLKLASKKPMKFETDPDWPHVGSKCSVCGEGTDEFVVVSLHENGALLECNGMLHGVEPYSKLKLPGVN